MQIEVTVFASTTFFCTVAVLTQVSKVLSVKVAEGMPPVEAPGTSASHTERFVPLAC